MAETALDVLNELCPQEQPCQDCIERNEEILTQLRAANYVLVPRSALGAGYRCMEESEFCDQPPVDHDWYCEKHMGTS